MAEGLRNPHHDPVAGGIPVPHGPDTGDDHYSFPANRDPENERQIFSYLLKPDDSYTPEGVYWADLPLAQRARFTVGTDNKEAAKELKTIGQMVKKDPLSPVGWYFRNAVLPGAGLGLEGYVLFSIGNIQPLFALVPQWKNCWSGNYSLCNKNWVAASAYLEIIGIIVGQISVGIIGDAIGRRWGLIQDAVIMFVGLLMLTASWGLTLNGWVICYSWALFFYGIGVGGEYPMTATAAMENSTGSGRVSTKEDRLHRGRKVVTAFLMQGWGQFFNQVILIILLLIFHGSGNPPYTELSAQWTYRVSFAIPAVGTLWLVYYRAYKMPLASKQLNIAKKKAHITGYDVQSLKLTFTHFGSRLFATCGAWFMNDVFFYGNKLFQSSFIHTIAPDSTSNIMDSWLLNLINIGVSLAGYYLASFLIDNKLYGRKMMMQVGFLMDFVFFVVPAFHLNYYMEAQHVRAFQAMYYLSSFFNQFGPNTVTFLVAAECFPTPIRATAHGLAAAVGKLGALLAAVLYNYIGTQTRFYVVPWFGLAGMVITLLFLPDTTGLDLKEQERRWKYIREGREHEYHGVAIHPQHLSLWERLRGVGKYYDPELDFESKMHDMRIDWEEKQAMRADAEKGGEDVEADDEYNDEVHSYFKNTPRMPAMREGKAPASETDSGDSPAPLPAAALDNENEKRAF